MNELSKPKIGLLPLMLEMYKKFAPEMEKKQKPFIDNIAGMLRQFADVKKAPICSRREEIKSSVKGFESEDIDLIVVVFISYSTSISAINPLLETTIPLLLFSTSPKSGMAQGMNMDDIMLNHGIHGYMDLANVLKRNNRHFAFVSGKKDDEGAYQQIEQWANTAGTRRLLGESVIGIAGYTFDGMGDFGIDTTFLHTAVGPEVKHIPLDLLAERIDDVSDSEIKKETELDKKKYEINENVGADIHQESNRVYLGLKKVVEELDLKAFTMHFQGMLENPRIKTLPFLAISKLQESGLCYSGEGDFLGATACMMLRYLCGDTVFTETFCPDFDGGRIVMAHMGESNPAFGIKTVLRRKKFVFGKAVDPVIADTHMKPQKTTVLNFGIAQDNDFQMVAYTGEVCEKIPGSEDIDMPYFHFKPSLNLEDFLNEYGLAGGTHHIAMTPGDRREDLIRLAEMLGIDIVVLM
jgi:L-arabinose isomerase